MLHIRTARITRKLLEVQSIGSLVSEVSSLFEESAAVSPCERTTTEAIKTYQQHESVRGEYLWFR